MSDLIKVRCEDFFASDDRLHSGPGLLVTNPPYGERLEDTENLAGFYSQMGRAFKRRAPNWRLAVFTGKPVLFHRSGLSRRVSLECANGGIDCKLLMSEIPPAASSELSFEPQSVDASLPAESPWARAVNGSDIKEPAHANAVPEETVPGIDQFTDRLRKNMKQLKGWAKSAGISNYRVYDCLLYTSPSPRDLSTSRMPSSA